MVVSGTKTITASVDPLRFAIKCSTGPTIPVESDGTPKSSSVNIEFYQFEADGSLSPYIADAGIIAFLNASGSAVSRKSIDSVSSYNITGDLADKSIVSVRVVLYEDVTAQAILASETFSLSYPTEVELPITVSLNNGASAIYCDANGSPKYYNILILNAIILAFKRGDSPVKVSLKSIAYIDGVEGEPYSYDTSDDGTFSDFLAANLLINNYITKIRYDFYPYGGSEDEMQSVEFPVVYDSPVPRPVGKSWSADMTFKNGEYIMLTTTSGGISSTMIYMWKYPIAGNTDVDPATYVGNNTKPTRWDRWEKNDLLATSVLLSDFALIGQSVFQGDYMMSQQGADAEGNESSDYTKFPDGFTPNILLNFKTGAASFLNVRVQGVVSASSVEATVKYVNISGGRNLFIQGSFNIFITAAETSRPFIFLPDWFELSGRILTITYGNPGDTGYPIAIFNNKVSQYFTYSNKAYANAPHENRCIEMYIGSTIRLYAVASGYSSGVDGVVINPEVRWCILDNPSEENPGFYINTTINETLFTEYWNQARENDPIYI